MCTLLESSCNVCAHTDRTVKSCCRTNHANQFPSSLCLFAACVLRAAPTDKLHLKLLPSPAQRSRGLIAAGRSPLSGLESPPTPPRFTTTGAFPSAREASTQTRTRRWSRYRLRSFITDSFTRLQHIMVLTSGRGFAAFFYFMHEILQK